MSEFYETGPVEFQMEKKPEAEKAIRDLEEAFKKNADQDAYTLAIRELEDHWQVHLAVLGGFFTFRSLEIIDKALEACARYTREGFVVEYRFDGEDGAMYFAPTEEAKSQLQTQHEARQLADRICARTPMAPMAYQPAIEALIEHSARTLVIGYYADDGEPGVFVLDAPIEEAEEALDRYLKGLDQGQPVIPGWPDSGSFKAIEYADHKQLLDWLALLKQPEAERESKETAHA